jgi:hypothetical protein
VVFYQVFLLSTLQCTVTNCRNFQRLREFEEIGHYLRVLRLEVSLHNVCIANQFQTNFARGGGGEGATGSS